MMLEMILFGLVVLCVVIILFCRMVVPSLSKRELEPWYLDYARSFFPVLLIVFLLRGFVAEPFRIPSGSMLPTLEVGDFILVNKFRYGIRLPILYKKVIPIGDPQRGDVMVFRYPRDNKTNYIKRVIGLPGDVIEYNNKRLYLNGELVEREEDGIYVPFAKDGVDRPHNRFKQSLKTSKDNADSNAVEFSVLLDPQRYSSLSDKLTVPEGHYFVMGDNRDHSQDSRYWKFVPDKNVVGNAFFIWFHWNGNPGGGFKWSRIGESL